LTRPRPRIFAALAALIPIRTAQPVSFRIQHCVQRLFDGAAHHLAKVVTNANFVDLYHVSHRFWLLVLVHFQLFSARLKGTVVGLKCEKDSIRYL
jgi:hypothetical protein